MFGGWYPGQSYPAQGPSSGVVAVIVRKFLLLIGVGR